MDLHINEELLDNIFCRFGDVADVTIKRHKPANETGSQSGYGFVFYGNALEALNAVKVMKHTVIDGVTYDCSISYKSERSLALMRDPAIQQLLQEYRNSCATASSGNTSGNSSHSQSPTPSTSRSDGQYQQSSVHSTASSTPVHGHQQTVSTPPSSYRSIATNSDYSYPQQYQTQQRSPPPHVSVPRPLLYPVNGRHSPRDIGLGPHSSTSSSPPAINSSSISMSSSSRDGAIAPRMASSPAPSPVASNVASGSQAPLGSFSQQQHPHLVPHQQSSHHYLPATAASTPYAQHQSQQQHMMPPLVSHHPAPYPLVSYPSNGAPTVQSSNHHTAPPAPQLFMPVFGTPMPPTNATVAPPSGNGYYVNAPPASNLAPHSQPQPNNSHPSHAMPIYNPYMTVPIAHTQMEYVDYNSAVHVQHMHHQHQHQQAQSLHRGHGNNNHHDPYHQQQPQQPPGRQPQPRYHQQGYQQNSHHNHQNNHYQR